jgi:hypothetical protein
VLNKDFITNAFSFISDDGVVWLKTTFTIPLN